MYYRATILVGVIMSSLPGLARCDEIRKTVDALKGKEVVIVVDRLSRLQANWLADSSDKCIVNTGRLLSEMQAAGWFKDETLRSIAVSQGRIGLGAGRSTVLTPESADAIVTLAGLVLEQSAVAAQKDLLLEDASLGLGCLASVSKAVAEDRNLEEELHEFQPFEPPADYRGGIRAGMDPAAITDPEVRKSYVAHLKRRDELNRRYNQRDQLRDVVNVRSDSIRKIIANCAEILGAKEILRLVDDLKLNQDERAVLNAFLPELTEK